MRLGLYDAILKNNTLISKIYSTNKIKERHRHRYEVNIKYKNDFEKKGLIFSALSPDGSLPEIIELKTIHGSLEFNFILSLNQDLLHHILYFHLL